ncbi:hypothetical protein J7M23_07245 [Candidatus Sumerlaeota bacterium]|nr:hypothetical protein [Candidatus Sumerlaeota bacterium]
MRIRIKSDVPILRSWRTRLIIVLICGAGIVWSALSLIKTDREIISETIRLGVRAVEQRDIDLIAPYISESYHGYYGKDRDDALRRARRDLQSVESVNIRIKKIDIKFPEENKADVVCYFFASGYYTGSDVYNRLYFRGIASQDPKKPDKAHFIFQLESDGSWRLIEAELHY